MPDNQAAFLKAIKQPLEVGPAPYTPPKQNQLVVRNRAVAVNPVDHKQQLMGDIMFKWVKFPAVIGWDVAGEVVEVGPDVKRFKVGDRVVGNAMGVDEKVNDNAHSAFQLYTVLFENVTSHIPDSLSFEQASVLPLALSTAAQALFDKAQLGLPHPSLTPASKGETLIIWGGSTSVGCNAIQLAVAAGYEVVTTSSPHNFELVKSMGASQAFDYKSPTVTDDVIKAMKGKKLAGAVALGDGATERLLDILPKCEGRRALAIGSLPELDPFPTSLVFLKLGAFFGKWFAVNLTKAKLRGVKTSFIWGSDILRNQENSKAIYETYVPEALAKGKFVAAPEPLVAGKGLEHIEAAFALQKKGLSAKKVVVSL